MSQLMRTAPLLLLCTFLFACNSGRIDFKETGTRGEKLATETPPSDLFPPTPPPVTANPPPIVPGPTTPPVTGNPPVIPTTEPTNRCGGPANGNDYTPYTELAQTQSSELFNSYGACEAARAAFFGNAMVCSKMVAATILGCMQAADYQHAVMQLVLAMPILKATGRMEVPYDYYLLDVPNCALASAYINSHMGAQIATVGQFTSTRADVQAECRGTADIVIHVLRTY
ncbi:MAG: hypothetical protein K2X47_15100 [Bdellovibrionales bacterium]|nr:hypothetical protein [Bdellovibrionales bacterium]